MFLTLLKVCVCKNDPAVYDMKSAQQNCGDGFCIRIPCLHVCSIHYMKSFNYQPFHNTTGYVLLDSDMLSHLQKRQDISEVVRQLVCKAAAMMDCQDLKAEYDILSALRQNQGN